MDKYHSTAPPYLEILEGYVAYMAKVDSLEHLHDLRFRVSKIGDVYH